MDKVTDGLDEERVAATFRAMTAAKVGIHVTFIAAFPARPSKKSGETVTFVAIRLERVRERHHSRSPLSALSDTPNRTNAARIRAVHRQQARGYFSDRCRTSLRLR